jgi:hypothetical protein
MRPIQEALMVDENDVRDTGRLAIAVGAIAAGSAVSLATYFAMAGPFGTINDLGNAATGLLSAGLAWRLRRSIPGRLGDVAVGAALVGAGLTVVGSSLVISGATGFFLAGLVSSVGFAGIGGWLLALSLRGGAMMDPSRRLQALGVAAGSLMAIGVATAPGIALRLDDMATAPGWIYIGSLSWLGIYVLYPAWAIWFGVRETRRVGQRPIPATSRSASEAS